MGTKLLSDMETETKNTIDYYNKRVNAFIADTVSVEFSGFQNEFAALLPKGGSILDLGCGSGRDSRAFIDMGFQVTAVDGSKELCRAAEELIGQNVICETFQEYTPRIFFDGIWACASLLHISKKEIAVVIDRLSNWLNLGGCFYMSFKYGNFSGDRNGRFYTDLTEESLDAIIQTIPSLQLIAFKVTCDVRKGREDEMWLNAFYRKGTQ